MEERFERQNDPNVSNGSNDPNVQIFIGGHRAQREAAVRAAFGAGPLHESHVAARWPFLRHVVAPPARHSLGDDATLWFRDLHLAFPPPGAPGFRSVLTQSTYQLQRLLDAHEAPGAGHPRRLVADGDNRLRVECAGLRGPWARIEVIDLGAGVDEGPGYDTAESCRAVPDSAPALLLHRATTQLATGSIEAARASVEEAIRLDPSWEAPHFELGKIGLRVDDTSAAATAFAEAGRLMPSFAAAFSNLGAALGEMDQGPGALAALEQALRFDPNGFPIVNNKGAALRDMGRLQEAETAFRRVIDMAPAFVFGYYNLGQTLYRQERTGEARRVYEEGFARDPQKNPRQACRLAVARAADGDASGALELLDAVSRVVPADLMRDLAGDIATALAAPPLAGREDLAGLAAFAARYTS